MMKTETRNPKLETRRDLRSADLSFGSADRKIERIPGR